MKLQLPVYYIQLNTYGYEIGLKWNSRFLLLWQQHPLDCK